MSGQYLDKVTDQQEQKVFAKDQTTTAKKIAKTTGDQSFTKPPDGEPQQVGWSSVSAIPEIYSAGELGLRYEEYVDGRPRGMWLNMVNNLMRMKLTVLGHGEWSDCLGLGTDTVFIRWVTAPDDTGKLWFKTGNWLVYGFHHHLSRRRWLTDLFIARFDHDAQGERVG